MYWNRYLVVNLVFRPDVTDPAFFRGRLEPLIWKEKPIIWQGICRKLHEKEGN